MGRIMAWTLSLTGGIVVVRDPCLHGRFSIGSLCVGPSDTMSWSPTIGLLISPQEPIQPRLGGRVERFPSTYGTDLVVVIFSIQIPESFCGIVAKVVSSLGKQRVVVVSKQRAALGFACRWRVPLAAGASEERAGRPRA